MSSPPRRVLPWLIAIAGLVALALFWPRTEPARPVAREARRTQAPLPPGPAAPVRKRAQKKLPTPGDPCPSEASTRCHEGDVWWVDGCGELETARQECGARLCVNGACEAEDAVPCREPLEGRCDGERVRLCIAGRSQQVDCGRLGLTCVMGAEGAECAPEVPRGQRCTAGPARCDGDTLLRCEAGRRIADDCKSQRAVCAQLPGTREAACVVLAPPTDSPCGACGCAPDPQQHESQCDGRDDDGNGLIDDGLACGAVPVIAFVVQGRDGSSSHSEQDIADELARVNGLIAGEAEEPPLRFTLAEVVSVVADDMRTISTEKLMQLSDDPRLHPAREAFYVPLLFTDRIESEGGVPRVGVSTLANGTCGGVHWGTGPEVGLVAVAKGRAPTTVAHELGHFLGLCHTHETRAEAPVLAVERGASLLACDEACVHEGDGVCDTPFDPGPETCVYDAACRTACQGGDEPEAENLMSYYTGCRQAFSPEQLALMQHTLALRRGWQPCLHGACACELGAGGCPADMSCRPLASGTRCTFDGPLPAGADCAHANSCGKDALCLLETSRNVSRCVRPCTASHAGCTCSGTEEGPSICLEDLG